MAIVTRKAGDLIYLAEESIAVPHAFTTRLGGVSRGIFASLNLGVNAGDCPEAVEENYDRITRVLGTRTEAMVLSRQVHGDQVRVVGAADRQGDLFRPTPYEADGLVTGERGVPLAIFTADCVPILLWDETGGAVGAVHAGWRSTVMNIAGKAILKLTQRLGANPRHIRAAIGPCIGLCCFETGPEVKEAVIACLGSGAADCIVPGENGKNRIDLKEVNRRLFLQAGLLPEHITVAEHCTMCMPETFWSHRATGGRRGSQAAMILRI